MNRWASTAQKDYAIKVIPDGNAESAEGMGMLACPLHVAWLV